VNLARVASVAAMLSLLAGPFGSLFRPRVALGGLLLGGRSATQTIEKYDAGRWVTIGGSAGQNGQRSGGSPVFIKDGRIVKGHPSLVGKKPGEIKSGDTDHGSHRKQLNQSKDYARAKYRKQARQAGHDADAMEDLARGMKGHHDAFAEERRDLLRHAREHSANNGFADLRTIGANERYGNLDPTKIRGFDQTTESTVSAFPHHFREENGEHGSHSDQLLSMLVEGNPKPMEWNDAYEQALNAMGERKDDADSGDDFSFGANRDDVIPNQAELHLGGLFGVQTYAGRPCSHPLGGLLCGRGCDG
jgi:hypothetical protein